ncbi:YHR029C [Saccharomyces arboricola H-6]|uniref:YHR029C n=1 Tax=Saccharomyces arboricola (strain H-6 / AS 2.3317 / CBS 10644) TaxID=1160507 RepID=J8Q194_SACAR|nr:YHR029C [Saccharomyces arboricola H-6]
MGVTVPFKQVDVFTEKPFKGNPVAVINFLNIDESEVTQEELQTIANWTNLSETTFLFKPSSDKYDYKLRIFTPNNELPFAGHPTIGSCKAFLQFTKNTTATSLIQECGAGAIPLVITEGVISFKAAMADYEGISTEVIAGYEHAIGLKFIAAPALLHTGPEWIVALVEDAETCFDANPNFPMLAEQTKQNNHAGIILAGHKRNASIKNSFEMRAFAPVMSVNEDPVCGSGSVALARYLQELYKFEETTKITISQGGRLQRDGHIVASIVKEADGSNSYHVAGHAITVVDGKITL